MLEATAGPEKPLLPWLTEIDPTVLKQPWSGSPSTLYLVTLAFLGSNERLARWDLGEQAEQPEGILQPGPRGRRVQVRVAV